MGLKYRDNHQNMEFIEQTKTNLAEHNIEMYCVERDFEKYGEMHYSEKQLMEYTFSEINKSDALLIDVSEKGIGIGIECGYAYANNKPIYIIVKKGIMISATIKGIATKIIEYEKIKDVAVLLSTEHIN